MTASPTDSCPTPSLLLSHAAALRRLAAQLVVDPNDADDAVQETWLRALAMPPRHSHRLRGWLEAVLRSVVRRQRRQRVRARRREERAAERGPQTGAAAAALVERQQALRALTAAVLRLDLPLQELVFARYFEDLPPRAIARRTERPVAEVYRGLQRARAELRRRLGTELGDGGWPGPLAALCGVVLPRGLMPAAAAAAERAAAAARPVREAIGPDLLGERAAAIAESMRGAASWLFATGVIMSAKKLLVGAVGLATLGGVILLVEHGAPAAGKPLARTAAPDARPMAAPLPAAAPEATPPERAPAPAPADDGAALLAPHVFELAIHARDEDDLPAARAEIWVAPELHPLNSARTGDDGVLRLTWRGRKPTMTIVWGSPDEPSDARRLHRCTVHAGVPATAALRIRGRSELKRLDLAAQVVSIRLADVQHSGVFRVGFGSGTEARPALQRDPDGTCWFHSGTGESRQEQIEQQLMLGDGRIFLSHVTLADATTLAVSAAETAGATGILEGQVLDARGVPAAGVLVVAGQTPGAHSAWEARTGDDGSFRIEGLPAATPLHLRAGGGEHGLATAQVELAAGATRRWDARLDRGLELRGQLLDERGQPLAGWWVEATAAPGVEPAWIDGARTGDDGSFAIPNVADRPHRLRARPPRAAVTAWEQHSVWPGGAPAISIPSGLTTTGGLAAWLHGAGVRGDGDMPGELQLWCTDYDEAALVDLSDAAGGDGDEKAAAAAAAAEGRAVRVADLTPALYAAALFGPGRAPRALPPVPVVAGMTAELGAIQLPPPATLAPAGDRAPTAAETPVLWLHDAVPSRAGALSAETGTLWLPAGRYRIGRGAAARELDVRPGPNEVELRPHADDG